jgi:hypothetical protein
MVVLLAATLAAGAAAQESPFVTPERFRALSGEISGDIAYDHLRHLTLHHSPNGASRGFRDKLRWIAERAREFGLEDVRLIDDLKYSGVAWTPVAAELWIVSPDPRRLTSFSEIAVAIADYSRSGTWEGELVDVGNGTRDSDYEGKEVKDKVVLASGFPGAVMNQAVWKRGALGVVYYNASRGISYPDQVAWTQLNARPPEGKQNTFAFSISYRAGMELKQRLGPRPAPGPVPGSFGEGMVPGEKIMVRAEVQTEFEENPKQWIVEGWIRGTNRAEKAIVLTAHGQEEKFSANDDNSGCANLLEIGRALVKLIREGKLPRPARDIRFWWVNEFASEYEYFSAYPEERMKLLVNINQDMVGAKQSAGSRIQHITRVPWSRASYLDTVIESIATLVMRGNSAYLSAGQGGTRQPYSQPIVSRMGTRERYGAEIVPYFDSTDHHVFNHSAIGVPGVTFTNWPDDFIHSSDDDLWQMDATQLQRNAFIVATAAVYLASVGLAELPALASQVHSSAMRDLAAASARATEMLALVPAAERDAAYADAVNLVVQRARGAVAALDSVRALGPDARVAGQMEALRKSLEATARSMQEALAEHYALHAGKRPFSSVAISDLEKEMAGKVPESAGTVREQIEKRNAAGNFGLHSLMAFEVWNFVDGRRSYLEIYKAVRAEAQMAGEWYYGKVTPKQVADLLDAGVKAGVLKLKP